MKLIEKLELNVAPTSKLTNITKTVKVGNIKVNISLDAVRQRISITPFCNTTDKEFVFERGLHLKNPENNIHTLSEWETIGVAIIAACRELGMLMHTPQIDNISFNNNPLLDLEEE